MKAETRNNITIYTALVILAFGITLASAGFIVSPLGEIHSSVLWIVAQCLIYAGSVLGVTAYTHGKISEINEAFINNQRQMQEFTQRNATNAPQGDVTPQDA